MLYMQDGIKPIAKIQVRTLPVTLRRLNQYTYFKYKNLFQIYFKTSHFVVTSATAFEDHRQISSTTTSEIDSVKSAVSLAPVFQLPVAMLSTSHLSGIPIIDSEIDSAKSSFIGTSSLTTCCHFTPCWQSNHQPSKVM